MGFDDSAKRGRWNMPYGFPDHANYNCDFIEHVGFGMVIPFNRDG